MSRKLSINPRKKNIATVFIEQVVIVTDIEILWFSKFIPLTRSFLFSFSLFFLFHFLFSLILSSFIFPLLSSFSLILLHIISIVFSSSLFPQEKERYLSRDNQNVMSALQNTYCTANYATPSTWNNRLVHNLSTTAEEYRLIAYQIPLLHRTQISAILRIQDADSWHMFSK